MTPWNNNIGLETLGDHSNAAALSMHSSPSRFKMPIVCGIQISNTPEKGKKYVPKKIENLRHFKFQISLNFFNFQQKIGHF